MIAIENVSIPESCFKCFCHISDMCIIGSYYDARHLNDNEGLYERPDWCPLNDLGDISIDELKEKINNSP